MKPAGVAAIAVGIMVSFSPAMAEEQKTAKMYKPLQCGCCDEYAKYLEDNGFNVEIESLQDEKLVVLKRMASVPKPLHGCHTLMLDGYVVEGLVPIETVEKLLTERPKIRGITLPGMPVGAPGMPGRKNGPLTIYELSQDAGSPRVFAQE